MDEAIAVPFTIQNTGDVIMRDVRVVIAPGDGVRLRDGQAELVETIDALVPGAERTFRVIAFVGDKGLRTLRAHVRDGRGWASAGVAQFFEAKPLALPSTE